MKVHNRRIAVIVSIAGALALSGCASGSDADNASDKRQEEPAPMTQTGPSETSAQPGQTPSAIEVEATPGYMVYGDPNAKTTIDLYSDYLCPHCAQFAADVLPELKSDALSGSNIKVVLHDFRVIDDSGSMLTAVAARAAGEQGKFDEMHDVLMQEQQSLHDHLSADTLDADAMVELAKQAGVPDLQKFQSDINNVALSRGVAEDEQQGKDMGVQGTPYVFVNGKLVDQPTLSEIRQLTRG